MKNRKSYWKKYYEVKVKPDKEKMAIRRDRMREYRLFAIKINGSLYRKMEREAKRRKVKVREVAEEIIRFAYK